MPVLNIDSEVNFEDISMAFIEQLQLFKPFGEGNRQPLFASFNVSKKSAAQKIPSGHAVWLSNGHRTLEAVVYDKSLLDIINFSDNFDIVYSLERNNQSFY